MYTFSRAAQCGKRGYHSKAEAKRAARELMSRWSPSPTGERRAYRCPHCEGWHIGHTPGADARRHGRFEAALRERLELVELLRDHDLPEAERRVAEGRLTLAAEAVEANRVARV